MRAVETKSFSAVARELGIGQPNVSRHIASLEQELGTRLLYRSTRSLAVTPEGQRYYAQTRAVLDAIDQAESDARGQQHPKGLLRVSCSPALGTEKLMGAMPDFLARYPDVQVEFRFAEHFVDLIAEGIDVAIRGGVLQDSALRARRIGTSRRLCVATPAYLAQHGVPATPVDLAAHQCIVYTPLAHGATWPMRNGDVHVRGRLQVNTLVAVQHAVLDSIGIGYLPSWMVAGHIARGALAPVLEEHAPAPTPLNAVYAAERLLPQRASVFIEYVAALFAATPGLRTEPAQ